MTIRFAGAHASGTDAIASWRCRSVALSAANDNVRNALCDTLIGIALRHFARHGLSAAEHAAARAATALDSGDRVEGLNWIAVCRQFDRRMADRLTSQLNG